MTRRYFLTFNCLARSLIFFCGWSPLIKGFLGDEDQKWLTLTLKNHGQVAPKNPRFWGHKGTEKGASSSIFLCRLAKLNLRFLWEISTKNDAFDLELASKIRATLQQEEPEIWCLQLLGFFSADRPHWIHGSLGRLGPKNDAFDLELASKIRAT